MWHSLFKVQIVSATPGQMTICQKNFNSWSMYNVQTDWGVDQSTFCHAGHVEQSNLIILKIK